MKIEVVKKETPKPETPFVVGGVYGFTGEDSVNLKFWTLLCTGVWPNQRYHLSTPGDGYLSLLGLTEEDMKRHLTSQVLTYLPNARLVIEE